MDRKQGLTNMGARVRERLAEDPRAGDEVRRGRAGFLAEVERRNRASQLGRASAGRARRWLPLGFAASVVASAAGVWIWTRPATFQIGAAREGRLGDVVEATAGSIVPVSFFEGSTLAVHHGGRIRVLSLDARVARVLVEDGVVDAAIARRKSGKTKWDFELGPYRVTVNGTKFRMAFHARERSLRVSTEEGRVTVAGGCLDAPRSVSAGESLEASCPPRDLPPPDSEPATPETEAPTAPAPPIETAPAVKVARGDRWRELLAAGQLRDGLRAAERGGFAEACRTATAKELLALADAGRFFGPSRRAVVALTVLRQRFPGTMEAGTAAFTLGRIVFEQEHAYGRAADWFDKYLREQPSGPLMGDAFGRLMEARLRSGDDGGARASAQQYLRRFPEGPYASEARGIMSK